MDEWLISAGRSPGSAESRSRALESTGPQHPGGLAGAAASSTPHTSSAKGPAPPVLQNQAPKGGMFLAILTAPRPPETHHFSTSLCSQTGSPSHFLGFKHPYGAKPRPQPGLSASASSGHGVLTSLFWGFFSVPP